MPKQKNLFVVFVILFLFAIPEVQAGGSGEQVVVVVNADSWASMQVSNEYVRLRDIPEANVIYLQNVPSFEYTTIPEFRKKILNPVLEKMEQRKIREKIDYIVYSADLPWSISFNPDLGKEKLTRYIHGSINGFTYLYEDTMAKDFRGYLDFYSNRYARQVYPFPKSKVVRAEMQAALLESLKHLFEREVNRLLVLRAWSQERIPELAKQVSSKYGTIQLNDNLEGHFYYAMACAFAQHNRLDESMQYLRQAVKKGMLNYRVLEQDADLKKLRETKAFKHDFKKIIASMKEADVEVRPVGFRNRYGWDSLGNRVADGGDRYFISTVLGVSSGRGNSVDEIIANLNRSAGADRSKPEGTVYYALNSDVRSRTREWGVHPASKALQALGVTTKTVQGKIPDRAKKIAGLFFGCAYYNWEDSRNLILPGAICENLTSSAGNLREAAGQTPISLLMRYGAAGASGTVIEPYAVQAKFPNAFIQPYYASGCTLGEAFYQSIYSPYQLLILGDPLCAPWAEPFSFRVNGLHAGATVSGNHSLRFSLEPQGRRKTTDIVIDHYELYIDGQFIDSIKSDDSYELVTEDFADGYHHCSVVAVRNHKVEERKQQSFSFYINNKHPSLDLDKSYPDLALKWGESCALELSAVGASRIEVSSYGRTLGSVDSGAGMVRFDSRLLGLGKTRVNTLATFPGEDVPVRLRPRTIHILPPTAFEPLKDSSNWKNLTPGLLLWAGEEDAPKFFGKGHKRWLQDAGCNKGVPFRIEGLFEAPKTGVYQCNFASNVQFSIAINGTLLQPLETKPYRYFPLHLKKGRYKIELKGEGAKHAFIDFRFGEVGTRILNSSWVKHIKHPKAVVMEKYK